MRKITLALLCGLLVVVPSQAAAITANEFRALPEFARMMYVVGTLDDMGRCSGCER